MIRCQVNQEMLFNFLKLYFQLINTNMKIKFKKRINQIVSKSLNRILKDNEKFQER